MNYKVIKYVCGCTYIKITDPLKATPYSKRCPEHKRCQKSVILWCVDCGKRIESNPKAGHKQYRCHKHASRRRRILTRGYEIAAQKRGNYRFGRYISKETAKQKDERIASGIFDKIREKYMPLGLEYLIKNQQDMPPEFARAVDEHFDELF